MESPRGVGDWIAGRYEVFEVHQGGMSLVYVAHDHKGVAGRQVVALKTLRDELIDDSIRRARFASECDLWVRLGSHPNIVNAVGLEECDGRPHVVLELVTGGDLRRWIGKPKLDLARALHFGVQFCLGMEHALRAGLHCHRDVKPGNLLVTEDGTLKITDFGLARVRDELLDSERLEEDAPIPLDEPDHAEPIRWTDPRDQVEPAARPPQAEATEVTPFGVTDSDDFIEGTWPTRLGSTIDWRPPPGANPNVDPVRLTGTGLMLGTVPYMAPEQFEDARSADVRADLYGFGIVLFEMITGRRPFLGNTVGKLRRQHARAVPPSIEPALPRRYRREAGRLDAVIGRCLAKDPAARFGSAAELRRALLGVLRRVEGGRAGA